MMDSFTLNVWAILVAAVAGSTGMKKGSLYYCFSGKEELMRAEQSVEEIEGVTTMCRIFGDPRYIREARKRVLERL